MARKRVIDPEFWSDEEIGEWSFAARLFYIGLWNFADDEGRFKAHNQLLKSQIFPYDKKFPIEKVKKELGNKIQWYSGGEDNSQYGYIRNFLKHQKIDRPYPSKLPAPPKVEIDEHSTNNRESIAPKLKENKIKEDNTHSAEFITFWETYPDRRGRRVGKQDCWVWWKQNKPDSELTNRMIAWLKADNIARRKAKGVGAFYPEPKDPERWLKDKGWLDDVANLNGTKNETDWTCKKCGQRTTSLDSRRLCPKCAME